MNEIPPCPKCGQKNAAKVGFTWWGGMLGPRIMNLVECKCGQQYNSKTGTDIRQGRTTYLIVSIAIGLVLGVVLVAVTMNM